VKLLIDRRILNGFRRRCLAKYPKEHVESVYGRIANDTVEIHGFGKIEHEATKTYVTYDDEELEDGQDEAEELKLEALGTAHSHPNCSSAEPSEHDWIAGTHDGELVMGIVAIYKSSSGRLRSRVKWWQPLLPLTTEIR
jgi:proteasome lid subunit RPN8/RPN11